MRYHSLKRISFLLIAALFCGIFPSATGASVKIDTGGLLKIILDEAAKDSGAKEQQTQNNDASEVKNNIVSVELKTGRSVPSDKVPIYAAPNAKSQILFDWYGDESLFVEATPVIDKSNNSRWYKVVYCWQYADFTVRQVQKLEEYNYSYAYINIDEVETQPISDYAKDSIIWTQAGRPIRYKIGDIYPNNEGRRGQQFKVPVTLLTEPKVGAQEIKKPSGLKYIGPILGTEDIFPICHADMDEKNFALIVDPETSRVIGWMSEEEWRSVPWEKKEEY